MRPGFALASLAAISIASGLVLLAAHSRGAGAQAPDISQTRPVTPEAEPLAGFLIVRPQDTRFGLLDWRGGLVLGPRRGAIGQLSGLAALDQGSRFLAIGDDGLIFDLTIDRDEAGVPAGVRDVRVAPLRDEQGRPFPDKRSADAEGLALLSVEADAVEALVPFEHHHRVKRYRIDLATLEAVGEPLAMPEAIGDLGPNRGLESIAVAPAASHLHGRFVVIAERGVETRDDLPGWIVSVDGYGGREDEGLFTLARHGAYDPTDAVFLPDGDLLVLERLFTLTQGVGMRIRRIPGEDIRPGARVDGEVLIEADLRHQIDNMEGLAVWERDGRTILGIVSDNNRLIIQRNLYLEFELPDAPLD